MLCFSTLTFNLTSVASFVEQKSNFDIIPDTISLGVAYDYNSIMHYPDWAFSINGKPTIEAVANAVGAEIGQRDGMTAGDIEQINKYYECEKESNSGKGGSFTKILKREMNTAKKPKDKKGGKCEAQFDTEQKNKERKMAWKESLMKQQEENVKKMAEEEKLAGMLKKRKKHWWEMKIALIIWKKELEMLSFHQYKIQRVQIFRYGCNFFDDYEETSVFGVLSRTYCVFLFACYCVFGRNT